MDYILTIFMRFIFSITSLFLILYSLLPNQSFTNSNYSVDSITKRSIDVKIDKKVNLIDVSYNNNIKLLDDDFFVVTAYYSPLPNQKYYLKGNYEAEKRLNGEGIKGASGKGVFSGMLAGPKNYKFGTKIYLEGLGVGVIEDRGGAIVNAGNRGYKNDRIDVWVGYGDEGLRRALYWGKRKIKGKIIDSNSKVSIDYKKIDSPLWVTKNFIKQINNFEVDLASIAISIDKIKIDNKNDLKLLQDILTKLGLYNGEIDGIYSNIEKIILKYQLDKKIIKNKNELGAGYFGPKTKKNIKIDYEKYLENEVFKNLLIKNFEEFKRNSYEKALRTINLIGVVNHGDVSYSVRVLQNSLKELGYFDYIDTAIFGDITKESLIKYQLDKKIISEYSDNGAGVFGPKTKEVFSKDLKKIYLKEFLLKEELTREELIILLEYKKVG